MEILAYVFWIVLRLAGEILLEGLLELGLEATQAALGRQNRDPVLATFGYLMLGATIGGLSIWLLPGRILPRAPRPGLSLVLSPVAAGAALELWGRHRRAHGQPTTNLATWHGGGALALGLALVRYLLVR